jgi:hypothetical protein
MANLDEVKGMSYLRYVAPRGARKPTVSGLCVRHLMQRGKAKWRRGMDRWIWKGGMSEFFFSSFERAFGSEVISS